MFNGFEQRLKECLNNTGFTITKITNDLEFSKNSINNYLNGRIPNGESLYKLSKYLGVSMEYLLTGKENYNELTEDELKLLEKYKILTERNKGKVETYIDERIAEQESSYTNDIKDLA